VSREAATAGRPRAGALYTPELLALAVSLADWPLDPGAQCRGEARSATCGSSLAFSCSLDPRGAIRAPGLRVTACAVGQAASAIFIDHAAGRDRSEIAAARDQVGRWLANGGDLPDWPGFAALEPARAYPARHGAILLAWNAALAALPKETGAS
jgi:NifU-like protein involved in Fe-S cluster formation